MAYRMEEITDTVRAGKRSDGAIDLEVWDTPKAWRGFSDEEPQQVIIPSEAFDALFEWLRRA